jgi:D-3-phosphoglycerate dehydrogenase
MKVLAYDEYKDVVFAQQNRVSFCPFEELIRESDYISLHVPLTEKTQNMLSTRQFEMMKRSASIINCSRGGVIDEEALFEALKNGVIRLRGLDDFQ